LPLIRTRGRVQIASGLDWTCSMTERGNCRSTIARPMVLGSHPGRTPLEAGRCGLSGPEAKAQAWLSQDEQLVGGRCLLGQHGAAERHDERDDAVDALGGLVLSGLEVTGGILGDGDV
jgi:hypothetical protein